MSCGTRDASHEVLVQLVVVLTQRCAFLCDEQESHQSSLQARRLSCGVRNRALDKQGAAQRIERVPQDLTTLAEIACRM